MNGFPACGPPRDPHCDDLGKVKESLSERNRGRIIKNRMKNKNPIEI